MELSNAIRYIDLSSETLQVAIRFTESASREKFRFRKKHMNLCGCNSEEREHGVGPGVNATVLSETVGSHGLVSLNFMNFTSFHFISLHFTVISEE